MPGTEGHLLQELRRYRAMAIRWLWFLALATILAGIGAYVVSRAIHPVYKASALLIVDAQGTYDSTYTGLLASDQLVSTYKALITQPVVLNKAASELKDVTAAQLGSRITIADEPGTQLIVISEEDTSAARAALFANTVATAFVSVQQDQANASYIAAQQQIAQQLAQATQQVTTLSNQIAALQAKNPNDSKIQALQTQLAGAQQNRDALQNQSAQLAAQHVSSSNTVRVFQNASTPTSPDHPKPLLNAAIGGAIGLLISCCLVFLFELFDDRVRTSAQLESMLGATTLTSIRDRKTGDLLLGPQDAPQDAQIKRAFGSLEANLNFIGFDDPLQTLVVTSALPGEGKTTVAVNLAISMSQRGKRVLLVDTDMRRPTIHQVLGLPNRGGLSLWLAQVSSPTPVVSPEDMPNLHVLTAGPTPPNPSQLLASSRMRELLTRSVHPRMGKVDVVIIDTPPLNAHLDGALVAAMADGAILVVDGAHLRNTPIERAKETLSRANAKIIGLVLNHASKAQAPNDANIDFDYPFSTEDRSTVEDLHFLNSHNPDMPATEEASARWSPDDN